MSETVLNTCIVTLVQDTDRPLTGDDLAKFVRSQLEIGGWVEVLTVSEIQEFPL